MNVSGQLHSPATLPLGWETLGPTEEEDGWAPEPVWTQWQRQKNPTIASAGKWTLAIQPVT
jgi:hypothetical protein